MIKRTSRAVGRAIKPRARRVTKTLAPRLKGARKAEWLITPDLLRKMDAWWRAANYLSVGQIYLLNNPLLKRALRRADIKPRLLGHWGTTPGLNFIYVHLNRVIK